MKTLKLTKGTIYGIIAAIGGGLLFIGVPILFPMCAIDMNASWSPDNGNVGILILLVLFVFVGMLSFLLALVALIRLGYNKRLIIWRGTLQTFSMIVFVIFYFYHNLRLIPLLFMVLIPIAFLFLFTFSSFRKQWKLLAFFIILLFSLNLIAVISFFNQNNKFYDELEIRFGKTLSIPALTDDKAPEKIISVIYDMNTKKFKRELSPQTTNVEDVTVIIFRIAESFKYGENWWVDPKTGKKVSKKDDAFATDITQKYVNVDTWHIYKEDNKQVREK